MGTRSGAQAGGASPKPLWKLGLDWLCEANGGACHSLDRDRARNLARGMRMVGEGPEYVEVSRYIAELWDVWPHSIAMVRDCWRTVYRAQTSLGRDRRVHHTPLYTVDRLIEKHRLEPVTEERLAAVTLSATHAFIEASKGSDTELYLARRRELDVALTAMRHLKYLRHGYGALGLRDLDPEAPLRPKWW